MPIKHPWRGEKVPVVDGDFAGVPAEVDTTASGDA